MSEEQFEKLSDLSEDDECIINGCSNVADFERVMQQIFPRMDKGTITKLFELDESKVGKLIRILKNGARNFPEFVNVVTEMNPVEASKMRHEDLQKRYGRAQTRLNRKSADASEKLRGDISELLS